MDDSDLLNYDSDAFTEEQHVNQLPEANQDQQSLPLAAVLPQRDNKPKKGPKKDSEPRAEAPSVRAYPPSSTIDHYGVLILENQHPQEEVVYKVTKNARHKPTRALFIGNLRRPINAILFQTYLRELIVEVDPSFGVDRAWMNKTRTHAIILFNQTAAAEAVRARLNGKMYPDTAEREALLSEFHAREQARYERDSATGNCKPPRVVSLDDVAQHSLYVDYCRVSQVEDLIYEEDSGPKNGKWQFAYRRQGVHGDVEAEHLLLEGDFRPRRDRENKGRAKHDRDRDVRNDGKSSRKSSYVPRDEHGAQKLRGEDRGSGRSYRRSYNRTRLRSRSPPALVNGEQC